MSFEQASPGLVLAASSSREVAASIERIFENVFDWEHLPHLHKDSFAAIELIEENPHGFKARLASVARPERFDLVEVFVERDAQRYWNLTSREGQPLAEVQVRLEALGDNTTRINLEFFLRPQQAAFGPDFARNYNILWDEDEAMMIARQHYLDARISTDSSADEISLGSLGALLAQLPIHVDLAGRRYTLSADGMDVLVFDATCPQWGGPLRQIAPKTGFCPWHGYRFDLITGRELNGRPCKLRPPARLVIDAQGDCRLVRPDRKA